MDQAELRLGLWRNACPGWRGACAPMCAYADMRPAEKALLREGVRRFFREVEKKKYKVHVRVFLSRYRGYTECNACGGARLREDALFIRVGGQDNRRSRAG